jgi:polynucleotide 5'-hydroxyl-kinase GRC3/NOL9
MGGPEMAPQLVQARGLRPLGLPGPRFIAGSPRPSDGLRLRTPTRPGEAVTPLDPALEAAAQARVTLILGTSDTGKTSLTARLAGELAARGERVAVVDADVGQSEIGPPTTVGLGRVTGTLGRLGDAEVLALEFIGDTSPVRYIRETADATGRLVRKALAAGFERVLIDTGGLVQGPLGMALKRAKVRAADPDVVLVLQRRDESEPIAHVLEGAERPRVVRLTPSPAVVRRTATRRREHREAMLRDYFVRAVSIALPTARVSLRDRRGRPLAEIAEGLLVGVLGAGGETLGIARVKAWEPDRGRIVVDTPVAGDRIVSLVAGRATSRE